MRARHRQREPDGKPRDPGDVDRRLVFAGYLGRLLADLFLEGKLDELPLANEEDSEIDE